MSEQLPRTPYHIADQSARALLGPIAESLAQLEARVAHYHDRLHMAPADREAVARARRVLATAVGALGEIAR